MKIGIDLSQAVYGKGVSVYTQKLVDHLLKIDKKNDYLLFGGTLRQKNKLKKFGAKVFPFPPTAADFIWNKLHLFPIENFLGPLDVFHSSDWTQPPNKAKKITTIHDLAVLRYPETFPQKIVSVHQRRLKWVKKEIDMVIAVSQSTKKDIIELLDIPEKKIKVIYEGVGEDFQPQSSAKIEKVKRKYQIKGDYLLAFTGPARKNLERIKKACKGLNLFVIGDPFTPQEDLPSLYSGALCLVYPSLYEGFGLPILEAMACGCPVLTSNISSLPEVAGQAGLLVDPLDVEEISRGINEIINNKEKRKELIKKGFAQVKKFSWEKAARETLKVYQEMVKK